MCRVATCCCCVRDVVAGAKIIGIVNLIFGALGLLNLFQGFDVYTLVSCLLSMIAQILLIAGVNKRNRVMVSIWLIYTGINEEATLAHAFSI